VFCGLDGVAILQALEVDAEIRNCEEASLGDAGVGVCGVDSAYLPDSEVADDLSTWRSGIEPDAHS
jgi:hypothetical protein